mmetsp:Transcript_30224/g.46358  ORF Transcript_30224/g.46358 Transcript_30224/m.46358 type:complete len:344 (-) Transcript_30224:147-1178(-)
MKFTPSAILIATFGFVGLSTTPTDAFAPPSASTFVPHATSVITTTSYETHHFHTSAVLPSRPAVQYNNNSGRRTTSSSSALQMNLVDRFMRVAKSNVNSVLMNLEGPEKIMNQAVEDMQKDLLKIRQSYAEVTAAQRRLTKQLETAEVSAQDWYNRAQLALQKGNDGLARAALSRRQEQLEVVKGLASQMNVQGAAIDKLYEGMHTLEGKILEAKQKKAQYAARAKTAESTTKVNDMLSGLTGTTSMDAFKRMEEKVEALEAAAEASAEMSSLTGNSNYLPGSSESELEKEFLLLEGSAAVEDELSRMKTKLLSGSIVNADVDPELENIRRTSIKIPGKGYDY